MTELEADPKKLSHEEFERMEIRVAKITAIKLHDNGTDYILALDMGPTDQDIQAVVSLKDSYSLEELQGKLVVALINVKPEEVDGVESLAMLLVTEHNGKKIVLSPEKETSPGMKVMGLMDGTHVHIGHIGR